MRGWIPNRRIFKTDLPGKRIVDECSWMQPSWYVFLTSIEYNRQRKTIRNYWQSATIVPYLRKCGDISAEKREYVCGEVEYIYAEKCGCMRGKVGIIKTWYINSLPLLIAVFSVFCVIVFIALKSHFLYNLFYLHYSCGGRKPTSCTSL